MAIFWSVVIAATSMCARLLDVRLVFIHGQPAALTALTGPVNVTAGKRSAATSSAAPMGDFTVVPPAPTTKRGDSKVNGSVS